MLTVDCIICKKDNKENMQILLIQRKHEPYKHTWALPGGFVDIDEELEAAANRELLEETNAKNIKLTQFRTYGTIGRDPRGRTITVIYYGFIQNNDTQTIQAGDDAEKAQWYDIKSLPKMGFDHNKIIADFIVFLNNKLA
jgi:8-oxo-dGTP diphosphatase